MHMDEIEELIAELQALRIRHREEAELMQNHHREEEGELLQQLATAARHASPVPEGVRSQGWHDRGVTDPNGNVWHIGDRARIVNCIAFVRGRRITESDRLVTVRGYEPNWGRNQNNVKMHLETDSGITTWRVATNLQKVETPRPV